MTENVIFAKENQSNIEKSNSDSHLCDKIITALLDITPLCVNIWNSKGENIMCNQQAVELFELENKQEYLDRFFELSPKIQPDGKHSRIAAVEYINTAKEMGECTFYWAHCKLNGEEIACEITLRTLDIFDEYGGKLIVGYTKDLRSQFVGNVADSSDEYYFSHITDKTLVTNLSELSDEWFFVYNIKNSAIRFFGKGSEILGFSSGRYIFPDFIFHKEIVYEDDMSIFLKFVENMKSGKDSFSDFRMVLTDGSVRYYRHIFKTTFDEQGNPIFVIGKSFDINEQKSYELLSQIDLLTNCYNKVTSEGMIEKYITKEIDSQHALFIIDIDDFKSINDNLGHHYGDIVLSDIASKLNSLVRDGDIVGRIGGDEFIVFLKNTGNKRVIEQRAAAFAKVFKNTYSGEGKDYKISGSIGISLYPRDGRGFEDLYKAADKALYQSKRKGKDCYTFYTHELVDGTMKNRTLLENASRIANSYFDSDLVSIVFDILYENKDVQSAINSVMEIVCKRTFADRCYIFETFDDGKTYDNTFEWCKDGINPEIDNLKGLTAEILGDFFESSDSNGVLYCNDLSLLIAEGAFELMDGQGIKSFLHVQLRWKDHIRAFIGLDDCTRTRVWSEKEINSMLYVLKLVSIYLYTEDENRRQ